MRKILYLLFFLTSFPLLSQIPENGELLINLTDPEDGSEEFAENLLQYYQTPVNINKAEREDLQALHLLSDYQIERLLEHRKSFGKFLSINELQTIEGFEAETIREIKPFITIGIEKESLSPIYDRILTNENHYLFLRTERTAELKKGYIEDSLTGNQYYSGSPWKTAIRWRNSRFNDFSLGFSFEKDAGEKIIWEPTKQHYGFDSYSWHIGIFNKGKIKALTIGDFNLQFGQGLVFGNGFNLGKGAESILTVRKSNTGLKPFSSFTEAGYLKGIATTISPVRNIQVSVLLSKNRIDGKLNTDHYETAFSTINISGYHRNLNEISYRKTIKESSGGGRIEYIHPLKALRIGVNSLFTQFNFPYKPVKKPYKYYNFSGTNLWINSLDYSTYYKNLNLFGEIAYGSNKGLGIVQGIIASLSYRVDYSIVFRNYSRNFTSFYGSGFSETAGLAGEAGLYQGIKIKPNPKIEISGYYDVFKFNWLRYRVDAPSNGSEYLVRTTYRFSKKNHLFIQYKKENKEANNSAIETPIHQLQQIQKSWVSLGLYTTSGFLSWTTRITTSAIHTDSSTSTGFSIAQDISCDFRKLNISARFALFETDNYESRHYYYEKDLLYSFYLPAYFGKGMRFYLVSRISLGKKIDCWIKIGRTIYLDRETISSGYEEIKGNKKTDLKFQLRYNF